MGIQIEYLRKIRALPAILVVLTALTMAACSGPSTSLSTSAASTTSSTTVIGVTEPSSQTPPLPTDTGAANPPTVPLTSPSPPPTRPTTATTATTSTTATTAAQPYPSGTGVTGRVLAGPTCPVEQINNPCSAKPVPAVTVQALRSDNSVADHTATDGNGGYELALAPGTYTLHVVTGSVFPRCTDLPVTVGSGAARTADIFCDTGIR